MQFGLKIVLPQVGLAITTSLNSTAAMKLICHPLTAHEPPLRPASSRRDWMDDTPDAFAYRCLPLAIANQHGWEVFAPSGLTAAWKGGDDVADVTVTLDEPMSMHQPGSAVSNFGSGILTFEMGFLLRTPPGWNIFVSGPLNGVKDGITALSGVIETDWSPYTFTMNWRFTRPGEIRFEAGEAIAQFFPVRRDLFDRVTPELKTIHTDPKTLEQMEVWRESRSGFVEGLATGDEKAIEEKWQKGYYRGLNPDDSAGPKSHKTKLHVPGFEVAPEKSGKAKPKRR